MEGTPSSMGEKPFTDTLISVINTIIFYFYYLLLLSCITGIFTKLCLGN